MAVKCAHCSHDRACDKKGKDCLGGTLDLSEYQDLALRPYLTISGLLQHQYGNNLTRLQELVSFGRLNEYKRISMACCAGLKREALRLQRVLVQHFQVSLVLCEICGAGNEDFTLDSDRRWQAFAGGGRELADRVNAAGADLNVAVGLCVEQDIVLDRYSSIPTTVLAVQDWALGHNPLAAVYASYLRKGFLSGKGLPQQGQARLMRLQEIIRFAQRTGCHTLGLGFCIGLADEARVVCDILERYFKVYSACCKLGGLDKKMFDIPYAQAAKEFECTCNPLGQAKVLNAKETDLNISLGLCIGHDTFFARYAKSPVTVLAPKDRVLGHNPLAAVYCENLYREYLSKRS